MAEVERPRCSRCSVPSIMGQFSVTVLLGDGNCGECQKAARSMAVNFHGAHVPGAGADDGKKGTGDKDVPYRFGRLPTIDRLGNWSWEQYMRLLELKSKYLNRKIDLHTPDMDGI